MTDEEKAMTQFKKTFCTTCKYKDVCDVSILDCSCYDSTYRQSYLDGLAEGRKESAEEIDRLEKEKCELLGIIQGKDKVIDELKVQIKEQEKLIETQYVENQTLGNNNATLIHRLGELSEHIEKLKCCGNCKYNDRPLVYDKEDNCYRKLYCKDCYLKNKWELVDGL